MANSLLAPFTKLARSLSQKGLKATVQQLYVIGDIKFGDLKGTDKFGNKYYENIELPFGQHRWVEYSNIHDFDATMIQPEWHGWMHHTYDEVPEDYVAPPLLHTSDETNAIYDTHVGHIDPVSTEQNNLSQYRQRGWKVGSRMTGAEDPDLYYKQPGHPLSPLADKGGRFKEKKEQDTK